MTMNVLVRDLPPGRGIRDALRRIYLRSVGSRPFEGAADERLESAALLSVDAFDTLITRSVFAPADVFAICGVELRARDLIAVDPHVWSAGRQKAESDAAQAAFPHEAHRDDIYRRLAEAGLIGRERIAEAQDVEWQVEQAVSRPVAAMIEAVNAVHQRGAPICIMSDTAIPQTVLCRMLAAAGLAVPADRVFTSSDIGHTKREGGLFDACLNRLALDARDVLHVGDNLESDLRRAKAAGLAAAPYANGRPTRLEHCLWHGLRRDPLLASVMAGSARATRLSRQFSSPHHQAIWDTSATFSGPLLFSYVAWTLGEAVRLGLRRLYFFSRDGEILIKIARHLQPQLAPTLECRYLLVSRQSLHLPAIVAFGPAEKEWILDCADGRSLLGFLARLNVDLPAFLAALPAGSPLHGWPLTTPLGQDGLAMMAAVLEQPAFQRLVIERATPLREACLSYMESEKLFEPGRIGVVDIGWRGRLQRSLVKILGTRDPAIRDRLHGFYIDLENPPSDAGALSAFSPVCGPSAFRWSKRGPLFEILCAAHHGTVTGYRRGALAQTEPELASPSNPEAERWGLAVQQQAIVAFTQEACTMLRLAGRNPLDHIAALAKAALDLTRLFVESPSRAEADCFGRFVHSEGEDHGNAVEIADVIDFNPIALHRRLRRKTRLQRISFWPEASVARSVVPWLRPMALNALRWVPGRRA